MTRDLMSSAMSLAVSTDGFFMKVVVGSDELFRVCFATHAPLVSEKSSRAGPRDGILRSEQPSFYGMLKGAVRHST